MKSITCKQLSAVLMMAALGTSFTTQANTDATVTVTAIVEEKLELSVDKTAVEFGEGHLEGDVVITTTNNTPAKITVKNDDGKDSTFKLKQTIGSEAFDLPVTATIANDADAKFDGTTHIMTHQLSELAPEMRTTLHLKAVPGENQQAGMYTGNLLIKIEKQ